MLLTLLLIIDICYWTYHNYNLNVVEIYHICGSCEIYCQVCLKLLAIIMNCCMRDNVENVVMFVEMCLQNRMQEDQLRKQEESTAKQEALRRSKENISNDFISQPF